MTKLLNYGEVTFKKRYYYLLLINFVMMIEQKKAYLDTIFPPTPSQQYQLSTLNIV